jgi:hypothetical protein
VSDDLNGHGAHCVHLSCLKLQSCPEVTRNQSDTALIESTIDLI